MPFWSGGMLSFVMALFLAITPINIKNDFCKIEKIEYNANSYNNKNLTLNIKLATSKRDVVQLDVYFYNKHKELVTNKYYSSSLVIDGRKETKATIPLPQGDKLFLNIIFYSGNLEQEIENIMFPIYPREFLLCDLNVEKICKSNNPAVVIYEDKKITEVIEKVSIINNKLEFDSFNNLVPIDQIKLISNLCINQKYSNLQIREKINDLNIYYEEGYRFLIKNKCREGIINFAFAERYYVDFFKGKTSQSYINDSFYINEVLLPYGNGSYSFCIEMEGVFINFSNVKVNFDVHTKGNLIGKCSQSKYCLRRNYL